MSTTNPRFSFFFRQVELEGYLKRDRDAMMCSDKAVEQQARSGRVSNNSPIPGSPRLTSLQALMVTTDLASYLYQPVDPDKR
jgi:hypothetical protein